MQFWNNTDPFLPKTKVGLNELGILFLLCNEKEWLWAFWVVCQLRCCHLRPTLLALSAHPLLACTLILKRIRWLFLPTYQLCHSAPTFSLRWEERGRVTSTVSAELSSYIWRHVFLCPHHKAVPRRPRHFLGPRDGFAWLSSYLAVCSLRRWLASRDVNVCAKFSNKGPLGKSNILHEPHGFLILLSYSFTQHIFTEHLRWTGP